MTQNEAGGEGVLIIRVWREPDARDGFRARIIFGAADDPTAEARFVVARDPSEVVTVVQNWLASLTG